MVDIAIGNDRMWTYYKDVWMILIYSEVLDLHKLICLYGMWFFNIRLEMLLIIILV